MCEAKLTSDIGVVIVTYNRIEKLKHTLKCYSEQKLLPKYIVIVNNASTDGTDIFLREWEKYEESFKKIIITPQENRGGSGGFYLGEKAALDLDADWIMIADDDAYPNDDYILGLQNYISNHNMNGISAIAGSVLENGSLENQHRSIYEKINIIKFLHPVPRSLYDETVIRIDNASYVGIVINKTMLQKVGLVKEHYFIWYDDTEHIYRLRMAGDILMIPKCSIYHDVSSGAKNISWKNYYGIRNKLLLFREHLFPVFVLGVMAFSVKALICLLKGNPLSEIKLRFSAIIDAALGRDGLHKIYRPGWNS